MPRDHRCSECGGMFHEDEMDDYGVCVYCTSGADSGQGSEG